MKLLDDALGTRPSTWPPAASYSTKRPVSALRFPPEGRQPALEAAACHPLMAAVVQPLGDERDE